MQFYLPSVRRCECGVNINMSDTYHPEPVTIKSKRLEGNQSLHLKASSCGKAVDLTSFSLSLFFKFLPLIAQCWTGDEAFLPLTISVSSLLNLPHKRCTTGTLKPSWVYGAFSLFKGEARHDLTLMMSQIFFHWESKRKRESEPGLTSPRLLKTRVVRLWFGAAAGDLSS